VTAGITTNHPNMIRLGLLVLFITLKLIFYTRNNIWYDAVNDLAEQHFQYPNDTLVFRIVYTANLKSTRVITILA
jgi:hypothetical protein